MSEFENGATLNRTYAKSLRRRSASTYVGGLRRSVLSARANVLFCSAIEPCQAVSAVGWYGLIRHISVEISTAAAVHFEDTAPAYIVGASGTPAFPTRSAFQADGLVLRVCGWCA